MRVRMSKCSIHRYHVTIMLEWGVSELLARELTVTVWYGRRVDYGSETVNSGEDYQAVQGSGNEEIRSGDIAGGVTGQCVGRELGVTAMGARNVSKEVRRSMRVWDETVNAQTCLKVRLVHFTVMRRGVMERDSAYRASVELAVMQLATHARE
jgi:hypothetical protein